MEWLPGSRMVVGISVVYPHGWRIGCCGHCCWPAQDYNAGLGKELNSKFKVQFLSNACHFCNIVKSKKKKKRKVSWTVAGWGSSVYYIYKIKRFILRVWLIWLWRLRISKSYSQHAETQESPWCSSSLSPSLKARADQCSNMKTVSQREKILLLLLLFSH